MAKKRKRTIHIPAPGCKGAGLIVFFLLPVCFLLFSAPAAAGRSELQEEKMLRFRAHPILMDSHGEVGIWEGEREKVFVISDVADIRQGNFRIVADRAVVWVEEGDGRSVNVRIYAEGAGRDGEAADAPVFMAMDGKTMQASAMHLSLRTLQGVAWECSSYRIGDIEARRFYERASGVVGRFGAEASYKLESLPDIRLESREPAEHPFFMLSAQTFDILPGEEEGKTVGVYRGNVHGTYGNVEVSADVAVLWVDTDNMEYELYARGDVILRTVGGERHVLERDGLEVFRADRLYINPSDERGLVLNPELRMRDEQRDEIYVVRGRKAYILDRENLLLLDAGTTNCPHGIPHYEFQAGRMQFIQQPSRLFAGAWNVSFVAGERQRSLFWVPYVGLNLDDQTYLLRSVSAGSSSFGVTLETDWGPRDLGIDPDWMDDWTVSIDYFSRRGIGLGTGMDYSFGDREGIDQRGSLESYYIRDRAEQDSLGRPVPRSDRGRLQFQHRVDWSPRWRTDLEYYHLSDHAFLREYFRSDFASEKAPETQFFTRHTSQHLWGGLQVKTRVNDFMTQREAVPGLELHVLDAPLGPFSYDSMFDGGLYEYKLSEEESFRDDLDRVDPPQITRLHTDHRLSMPMRIGFLKIDPYLRLLGTHASKGAEREGSFRGSATRFGGGGGFRAAADFSRMYNVRKEKPELSRLRHIVTPYLEAERLEVDTGSGEFIQMRGEDPWPRYGRGPRARDDWIDAIDDTRVMRIGLRQRLQTKRDGRSLDWVKIDVTTVFRSEDSVGVAGEDDNYVEADLDWKLTRRLTLASEDNRFSLDDGLNVFNLAMQWDPAPRLGTSLRYNWIEDRTSSVTGSLDVELSDRYSLALYERYEFDRDGTGRGRNLRTDVILSRWFHKWLLQMEFFYDGRGDGDRGFFVRFSPSFLDPFGRRDGLALR